MALWSRYRDRLSERGDARGELIRLEQRRALVSPADREAVDREIAALVRENQPGWDAEFPEDVTVLERRHGFATKVAVTWSEDAPVLVERALRAPFVTALRIVPDASEEDDWDEDSFGVDKNGEPKPDSSVETGPLATLDIGGLSELDLAYLRIGALGAKTLAVAAYVRAEAADFHGMAAAAGRIETLDLRYCRIGDAGLQALAAAPAFGGVRRLYLQDNVITARGVPALCRFERLTELDLRYNNIGAEGTEALLAAPFTGSLRRLLLHRADVSDDGVKVLANAPGLPSALRSYWRSV